MIYRPWCSIALLTGRPSLLMPRNTSYSRCLRCTKATPPARFVSFAAKWKVHPGCCRAHNASCCSRSCEVRPKQKGLERAFAQAHEMRVTKCVQFNDKLYYIFTRQDGAEQRLTAAGAAAARLDVKQLVQAYTAWQQEPYGMAIAESLQLVVDHSDNGCKGVSNAELSAGLGCKPELELQSPGEDFEAGSPDQHDPSVSSTELADAGHQVSAIQANEDRAKMVNKRPKQKGLERAFAQAHEMQVTRCVQLNDKLYYIFTRQDGAEQRLTASGVAAARLDVKQLVQAYTVHTFVPHPQPYLHIYRHRPLPCLPHSITAHMHDHHNGVMPTHMAMHLPIDALPSLTPYAPLGVHDAHICASLTPLPLCLHRPYHVPDVHMLT